MATDTERTYTGTNFAVITVGVLLVLVGGYFLVANLNDLQDDPANKPVATAPSENPAAQ